MKKHVLEGELKQAWQRCRGASAKELKRAREEDCEQRLCFLAGTEWKERTEFVSVATPQR